MLKVWNNANPKNSARIAYGLQNLFELCEAYRNASSPKILPPCDLEVIDCRLLSIHIDGLLNESIDNSRYFDISIVGGTICYNNGALRRKKLKLGNR
jgi:hypothetical protein